MANVEWDDDNVAKRLDFHKFKKGFSRFNVMAKNAFYEKAHYFKGYRVCTKHTKTDAYRDPGGRCYYCEIDPSRDPMDRFGTWICFYYTDEEANPFGPLGQKSFQIKPWFFSPEQFTTIKTLKKQWGDLREKDIIFNCSEERYQRGTMSICPEAWWRMDPTFQQFVVNAYKNVNQTADLSKLIATWLTYDKQREQVEKEQNPNNDRNDNRGRGNGGGKPQFDSQAVRDRITPQSQPMFGGSSGPSFNQTAGGQSQNAADVDDLLGGTSAQSTPQATTQSQVTSVAPANTEDLDSMLADLGG